MSVAAASAQRQRAAASGRGRCLPNSAATDGQIESGAATRGRCWIASIPARIWSRSIWHASHSSRWLSISQAFRRGSFPSKYAIRCIVMCFSDAPPARRRRSRRCRTTEHAAIDSAGSIRRGSSRRHPLRRGSTGDISEELPAHAARRARPARRSGGGRRGSEAGAAPTFPPPRWPLRRGARGGARTI